MGALGYKSKLLNSYAKCNINAKGDISHTGAIVGFTTNTTEIENCFFVGTASGIGVNPIRGTSTSWAPTVLVKNVYSVITGSVSPAKTYSQGEFASYQLAGSINDGNPVMKELFNVFEPNGTAVISYFTSNGFVKFN